MKPEVEVQADERELRSKMNELRSEPTKSKPIESWCGDSARACKARSGQVSSEQGPSVSVGNGKEERGVIK